MTAISVSDLHKSYDGTEAVRGVSFDVAAGEVFCLLGPNGAGKTTTVEILEGYRLADSGRVRVLGADPARGERALRDRLGIVLQAVGLQPELTVAEVLEMYGRWYERTRPVDELLELVELSEERDARVQTLSGGQQRRLDLALGLVGDPELLFLDEPTTGFDAAARRRAWSTIRSLCSLGKTVVLTTHFMDEAQHLADRVAVMVEGRIIALGPPEQLAGRDALPAEIRFRVPETVHLPDLPGVTRDGQSVLVRTPEPVAVTHRLTGWALETGVALELRGRPAVAGRHLPGADVMTSALSLIAWQVRYEQRSFWRNRRASLFGFLFPVLLFVIFATLNKHAHLDVDGGVSYVTWYLPGIIAYALVTSAFSNLAISLVSARDTGVLKRVRGTPLPWWAFLAGRVGSSLAIAGLTTALLLALGAITYGVDIPVDTLPGLVLALVLGATCFTALGIAVVRFMPSAESAGPVLAILVTPVALVSNVFFPVSHGWITDVAGVLPLRPLSDALHAAFSPATAAPGIEWSDLLALAVWLAFGSAMMVRFLRVQARAE
jgi:ABC-2 type transport system ATP-binding protein